VAIESHSNQHELHWADKNPYRTIGFERQCTLISQPRHYLEYHGCPSAHANFLVGFGTTLFGEASTWIYRSDGNWHTQYPVLKLAMFSQWLNPRIALVKMLVKNSPRTGRQR
jgi:hypothetical protein